MILQDLSGGAPVPIEGTELPLWAMEIDAEKATADFRASSKAGKGKVSNTIQAVTSSSITSTMLAGIAPVCNGCAEACGTLLSPRLKLVQGEAQQQFVVQGQHEGPV